MIITYDPDHKSVWVDEHEYTDTFHMPLYLREEFDTIDWLCMNQYFNWINYNSLN
jgi:hypothetical protein